MVRVHDGEPGRTYRPQRPESILKALMRKANCPTVEKKRNRKVVGISFVLQVSHKVCSLSPGLLLDVGVKGFRSQKLGLFPGVK
jgi:hypothetical protein